MRFTFNEKKTAQAAAHLLRKGGGEMNYMKLIKLLYLADRQSLLARGLLISGDRLVAMKRGPVLSRVLNLIKKGTADDGHAWSQYISAPQDYEVRVQPTADCSGSELSPFETSILDRVFADFGHLTPWELVDRLHERDSFPEWRDPGDSAFDIHPEAILRQGAWSEEDIEEARNVASEMAMLGG